MCGLENEKQGWAPLPGLQDVPGAGLWGLLDFDNKAGIWLASLGEPVARNPLKVGKEANAFMFMFMHCYACLYLYFGSISGHLPSLSLGFLSVKWG